MTKPRRVAWLLANPRWWEGFPARPDHPQMLFKVMQSHGFYRQKTHWSAVNMHALVSEARRIRREGFKRTNS